MCSAAKRFSLQCKLNQIFDNESIFLFSHSILMFGTASYEEVKAFANKIMTSTDNVKEVYDAFINNSNFQNDYNIFQLSLMLNNYIDNHQFEIDTKHTVEMLSMFMSKYRELDILLPFIRFPNDAIITITYPNENEPITYKMDTEIFCNLIDGVSIKVSHNKNLIMSATVIKESVVKSELRVEHSCIYNFNYVNLNIQFHDINEITIEKNANIIENLTDIGKCILDDNQEMLSEELASQDTEPNVFIENENLILPHILSDIEFYTNPIYYTMLTGSVKCFKYLYANGYYDESTNIGDYCVAIGKNREIFRILYNDNRLCNKLFAFKYAIQMHDTEMVNFWLVNENFESLSNIIIRAIIAYNYEILDMLNNEYGQNIFDKCQTLCTFSRQHSKLDKHNFEVIHKYFQSMRIDLGNMYNKHVEFIVMNPKMFSKMSSFDNVEIALYMIIAKCNPINICAFISSVYPKNDIPYSIIYEMSNLIIRLAGCDRKFNGRAYLESLIGEQRDWIPYSVLLDMFTLYDINDIDFSTIEYFVEKENFKDIPIESIYTLISRFIQNNKPFTSTKLFNKYIQLFINNGVDKNIIFHLL